MKKAIFLVLLLFICTGASTAQKLTWGEIFEPSTRYIPSNVLGIYDNKYFIIMEAKSVKYLQAYASTSMKLESEIKLNQEIEKESLEYYTTCVMQNKIHVFYKKNDKRKDETSIFVATYNTNLQEISKLQEVASFKIMDKNSKIDLSISNDSSKASLFSVIDKQEQKYTIFTYNHKMEKISTKNLELPYTNEVFSAYRTLIDNQGNFYLFGRLYETAKDKRQNTISYKFEVFAYNQDGSKSQKTINLGSETYIEDIHVLIDNEQTVRIIGFYGENGKIERSLFTISLDKDLNILSKSKKECGDGLHSFKEIIKNSDGSWIALTEASFKVMRGNAIVCQTSSIMWIKIDKKFELETIKKIFKTQIGANDLLHSFVSYSSGDGSIMLIFNDEIEEDSEHIMSMHLTSLNKISTFYVKIDQNGNIEKKLLFDKHPKGFFLLPRYSVQANNQEVLLFNLYGKQYLLGKVTF